jgi:predicted dehydrogenase
MQSNLVRWGVLGTARIADSLVNAIRSSENCELTAIASRDRAHAQAWAAERDVPLAFGSYGAMLASDAIDAVYVPLPNALHREWAIRAAQNGKHILCEKPLATGAHEAEEMVAAAEANGVRLMEAFMYRFHPQTAQVKQFVEDGAVGEVKMVRANFGFHLSGPDDVRWSKELGGGALLDVGCYCVNVARLVMGAEPVSVSATANWASTGVDETICGVLEFSSGALGVIGASLQTGAWLDQSLVVSGTKGRINVATPFRMSVEPETFLVDNLDNQGSSESVQVPGANEYQRMVEHFASALLNDRPPDYTPHDSLGNMRVLDALLESARTGRSVAI